MLEVIRDRYEKHELLGSGSYGTVYKVFDRQTKKYYAMKVENKTHRTEREIEALTSLLGEKGFLQILDHFVNEYGVSYIVFTLIGTTLHSHAHYMPKQKLGLKTVLLITDQLIERLKVLHSKGYVHRDIKTDNIAMGLDQDKYLLYLLDFGMVKKFKEKNKHIDEEKGFKLIGNGKYASLNNHKGQTQSRRDDLEAVSYLLIRLIKGKVPWDSGGSDYDMIYKLKKAAPSVLCQGLDKQFADFLRYARNLKFKDKPDYNYVKKLFRELFEKKAFDRDYIYMWTVSSDPAYIAAKEIKKKKKLEEEEERKKVAVETTCKSLIKDQPPMLTPADTSKIKVLVQNFGKVVYTPPTLSRPAENNLVEQKNNKIIDGLAKKPIIIMDDGAPTSRVRQPTSSIMNKPEVILIGDDDIQKTTIVPIHKLAIITNNDKKEKQQQLFSKNPIKKHAEGPLRFVPKEPVVVVASSKAHDTTQQQADVELIGTDDFVPKKKGRAACQVPMADIANKNSGGGSLLKKRQIYPPKTSVSALPQSNPL